MDHSTQPTQPLPERLPEPSPTPFIPKIGLSGGIASGKSTVAAAFGDLGITVIYADQIARDVVEPGTPALAKIAEHFGEQVLQADGALDRAAMRNIVFSEHGEQARLQLEAITHPAINQAIESQAFAASGPYVVLELPLLVEKQHYDWLDRVLIVDIPTEEQLRRLAARSGIEGEQANAILATQASREQRIAVANDVFDNSGPVEELTAAVAKLDKQYRLLAKTGQPPVFQAPPA